MPEKSSFLRKILNESSDLPEESPFTSERQLTAQAFNLHVARRDGRHAEGFAWSHYVGYRWTDDGSKETLIVLFGGRAVEIEGHNLRPVVNEIREGQLNSIKEMVTAQADLKKATGESDPIVASIKTYPDFDELLNEIKGDEGHDTGFARKARGR
jgi:hypothetical protein